MLLADFRLSHRERSLHESPSTDASEDAVAMDGRCRGGDADSEEERFANQGADSAEEEPGRIVSCTAHDAAVSDAGEYQDADEGEEVDAGSEGGGILDELEEEGDEIDRDECRGTCASCGGEE